MVSALIPSVLIGQPGKVKGTVKDAETNEPLSGVTVIVEGTVLGAPTDNNGRFTISRVPAGRHSIRAAAVGYTAQSKSVEVPAGEEVSVEILLQPNPIQTSPVLVTALRAVERETPVAFANVTKATIQKSYTVQDVPMLLKNLPGLYAYADGGIGLGDASLWLRGFSQDRVQTMINDIPENDPESRRIYWNDFPDLLANVSSIQVQRGVGNSLYGTSALGGSINIQTADYSAAPGLSVTAGYGSYRLRKISVSANTGLISGRYAAYARVSHLQGDGYRDYSWADYWGYFIGGAVYFERLSLKMNFYQSPEINHYSYFYPTLAQMDQYGRTYNPQANEITNPQGIRYEYNQYNQPHYELHADYDISPEAKLTTSLFYIRGNGFGSHFTAKGAVNSYFPNYVAKDSKGKYFFLTSTGDTVRNSDVAYRWVTDNFQYGLLSRLNYKFGQHDLTAGIELRKWHARHYGIIDYAALTPANFNPTADVSHFYDYDGDKFVFAGFVHTLWRFGSLSFMGDLQYAAPTYYLKEKLIGSNATNVPAGVQPRSTLLDTKTPYSFVTPRLGVNYNFTPEINIFANFSQAKQEPAQGAIYNAGLIRTDLKPEFLRADVELGAGYVSKKVNAKLNYFYMDFTNELVSVYDPTNPSADSRGNTVKSAGHTLHSGVEFDATASPVSNLQINANLTVSNNKFIDWKDVSKQPNGDIVTFDYSNKKLPYFPTYMANLGATYTYEGAYINLALSRIGPQYMDNLNLAAKVDAYTVVNAILGYSFHDILGAKSIDLTLNLNNITNSKYFVFGRASDTYNTSTKEIISSTPVYLPAPPANYFATIQFNW